MLTNFAHQPLITPMVVSARCAEVAMIFRLHCAMKDSKFRVSMPLVFVSKANDTKGLQEISSSGGQALRYFL